MNKRDTLILAVLVLILLGFGASWGSAGGETVKTHNSNVYLESESALISLKNLKWMRYFASARMDTLDRKSAFSSSRANLTAITSKSKTKYAVMYGCNKTKIPSFLVSDFDRIFEMVASYFNLNREENKVVIWVTDFDDLQKLYPGQKNYPGGNPDTVAALYAPHFDYSFFTPRYMNDYYVTHELIHHFIDEYQEEVVAGLPEVIIRLNTTGLSLEGFISQHEEEIAIELPQIIIRKNLSELALQGA